MLTYLLFIFGFVLLIKGADWLVDGSGSIARRLGLSDLVIGLTIVSFGTSAPELLVNVIASIQGKADLGVGNILGSNISNILLILGISALIYPLKIQKTTTWKEVPLNFLSAIVLLVMANDIFLGQSPIDLIGRGDGIILIGFFAVFMYYTFGIAKSETNEKADYEVMPLGKALLYTAVGIVALAFGGQWVVDGAILIAESFGLSEALIGLTIVAVGTSLPELATSAVAAYKKQSDIAIGNVVGSNLFNIFWVLGLSAIIHPIPFNPVINTDLLIYIGVTLLLFLFSFVRKRYQLGRVEGGIFVAAYGAYVVFLVLRG
ncbi:calcium/sodium antiporter [Candidatus Peregrinibacteria bacterium]|nr:MAG: calcium/sodium antiporter [Candidatus Peregrinibacteria bacterium]